MSEPVVKWNDTLVLDHDLWMLTREVQRRLGYAVKWEKVDSHLQEKLKADSKRVVQGNPLAWRLNEAADELARVQRLKDEPMEEIFFGEAVVMVSYRNSYIYGSIEDSITEGEHGPPLQEYLMEKYMWDEKTFSNISSVNLNTPRKVLQARGNRSNLPLASSSSPPFQE